MKNDKKLKNTLTVIVLTESQVKKFIKVLVKSFRP